jgi:hypothetical protein
MNTIEEIYDVKSELGSPLRVSAEITFRDPEQAAKNLEGRCLQRLEASDTPLGAASGSPSTPVRPSDGSSADVEYPWEPVITRGLTVPPTYLI